MKGIMVRRLLLFGSFLIIPVTLNYFSPVLIIAAGFERIAGGAFFVWTGMLGTSLVFGRAFCAYLCPYGGLQMAVHRIAPGDLKVVRGLRIVKYILGAAWIALILYTAIRGLNKIDFFYLTENYVSMDSIYSVFLFLIIFGVIFTLSMVLGKRGVCHYLCPMSVLNIIGAKIRSFLPWPSLHLEAEAGKCTRCRRCSEACPMSLTVMEMVGSEKLNHSECILCGECSAACQSAAIQRAFVYRKKVKTYPVKQSPLK
jgi:ferredoxin-type protein NapH